MPSRGHLSIVRADLTRLAADAFLIPCDSNRQVAGHWRAFLGPEASDQPSDQWFVPTGWVDRDGYPVFPDTTAENEKCPDAIVGTRILVDTVGPASIPAMVEVALQAVAFAASIATMRGRRALPLVALPILGVGQGNFPGRRLEVLKELVLRLEEFVATRPIDVALCLVRPADLAAAQWARHELPSHVSPWAELSDAHRALADELGTKAAAGQLSLFVGAGASVPVGFPSWKELLTELATDSGMEPPAFPEGADYPQIAEDLRIPGIEAKVAERFRTRKHALAHALLADLGASAMVTTNYDPCLENAIARQDVQPDIEVLTRQVATGGRPWLLKMHGDLEDPRTVILTRSQYDRLHDDLQPLRGVVQSLMLTSHLLFVGFGFAEDDFLKISDAVQGIRSLAKHGGAHHAGTAIKVAPDTVDGGKEPKKAYPNLRHATMTETGGIAEGARLLEILLDRIAWTCAMEGNARAAFLLDGNYLSGLEPADRAVRDALLAVESTVVQHPTSAGSQRVSGLLRTLGR